MVLHRVEPRSCISFRQSADSNCRPRSVVTVDGTPNHEIHPLTNALATTSAVIAEIGMASVQRVNLSTHVKRYEQPSKGGSGPTMSMWIKWNLASGVEKVDSGVTVWHWTLQSWHC